MSMTGRVLKERSEERKSKNKYQSKKLESALFVELKEKLGEYLKTNDSVMLEVRQGVVGEFMNAINGSILAVYDYEQVDKNKFIFTNKELEF